MSTVSKEVATQDIEKWLEYRKVKDKKIQESLSQQEELIAAIEDGSMVVDSDFNLVFKLAFPIKNPQGEVTVSELKFKPRIFVHELNAKLKGVSASSPDERILAYAAALTGQTNALISKLDTEDYRIVSSIVMYFL